MVLVRVFTHCCRWHFCPCLVDRAAVSRASAKSTGCPSQPSLFRPSCAIYLPSICQPSPRPSISGRCLCQRPLASHSGLSGSGPRPGQSNSSPPSARLIKAMDDRCNMYDMQREQGVSLCGPLCALQRNARQRQELEVHVYRHSEDALPYPMRCGVFPGRWCLWLVLRGRLVVEVVGGW